MSPHPSTCCYHRGQQTRRGEPFPYNHFVARRLVKLVSALKRWLLPSQCTVTKPQSCIGFPVVLYVHARHVECFLAVEVCVESAMRYLVRCRSVVDCVHVSVSYIWINSATRYFVVMETICISTVSRLIYRIYPADGYSHQPSGRCPTRNTVLVIFSLFGWHQLLFVKSYTRTSLAKRSCPERSVPTHS